MAELEIKRISSVVRSGMGSPKHGRTLFEKQCARCHTFFGQGAKVGPDLTSYQRNDLDSLVLNVVLPSSQIREGFEVKQIATNDGVFASGVVVEHDQNSTTLRGADGRDRKFQREDVAEIGSSTTSIMPEGLLTNLSDQDLRDLFAYLRISQPLIDR